MPDSPTFLVRFSSNSPFLHIVVVPPDEDGLRYAFSDLHRR